MAARHLIVVGLDWDAVETMEAEGHTIVGVIGPAPPDACGSLTYLGRDEDWEAIRPEHSDAEVILTVDQPRLRSRLLTRYGEAVATFVSAGATVSHRARIGAGSFIQTEARVQALVETGSCCKLNIGAMVHHECVLGDYVTVAPRAVLLGNVTVGAGSYIGAGAVIRQRIRIGERATIGAGAVVVSDVEDDATVVGVPARRR